MIECQDAYYSLNTKFGVVPGALVIGVLNSGLVILKVLPFWQKISKGCVMLPAVGIDKFNTKKQ